MIESGSDDHERLARSDNNCCGSRALALPRSPPIDNHQQGQHGKEADKDSP